MIPRLTIILFAGAVVLLPLAAPTAIEAQQTPPRVGVITSGGWDRANPSGRAFQSAMKALGYDEGRDYIYEPRLWQQPEQVAALSQELVRLKVAVIVAVSPQSIAGARSVTDSVPIVMVNAADPIALGLVKSIGRPGGNLTGLSWDHGFESAVKMLELVKDALPKTRVVAILRDAADPVHQVYFEHFEKAGRQIAVRIVSAGVRQLSDLEPAFTQMRRERADALIAFASAVLTPHHKAIMTLASRHHMPTLAPAGLNYQGALLAWGPRVAGNPARAARYVDQILKGAKPGDLPIEQPTKYELLVDLRVARRLGLTIPPALLLRADQVIE
jgi:putative ABC transport system substrate-binding protein